ncbi:MAG: hypothetical protein ACOY4O_15670, partial [Pseudomonadota bacterium]
NAGRVFGIRGDYARVLLTQQRTRLRTHDASGVPRALYSEGEREEDSGAPAPQRTGVMMHV